MDKDKYKSGIGTLRRLIYNNKEEEDWNFFAFDIIPFLRALLGHLGCFYVE